MRKRVTLYSDFALGKAQDILRVLLCSRMPSRHWVDRLHPPPIQKEPQARIVTFHETMEHKAKVTLRSRKLSIDVLRALKPIVNIPSAKAIELLPHHYGAGFG